MTSVNSDYAAAGASTTSSAKSTSAVNSSTNLGKDEFLKILMTQVQNQDPLNPVDDKEFISQMATFSSLEQMMNMNTTMTKFVENQDPFTMYVNWIGKMLHSATATGRIRQARSIQSSIQTAITCSCLKMAKRSVRGMSLPSAKHLNKKKPRGI